MVWQETVTVGVWIDAGSRFETKDRQLKTDFIYLICLQKPELDLLCRLNAVQHVDELCM